ncbi:Mitogen-activated protein kinase [Tulasnella sp. JGI-2019a]|nr:Mitogen-activated protein kinase [Tulasnella sp. JGI-2019a]
MLCIIGVKGLRDTAARDDCRLDRGPSRIDISISALPYPPAPPIHHPSPGEMAQQHHSFQALSQTFVVDSEYQFVKELGQGAYGCVVAAKHKRTGEGCAIKKITSINTKRILTKRCLREIKLLHHFRGHKNITCLYDMDIIFEPNGNFNEVYLYEELMEADLHAIVRSGQPLSDAHFQSFLYQTLCGLKYIHSANVLHRDLKPGNLLVNADCELKICDFGLARGYTPAGGQAPPSKAAGNQGFMTEYVATRWYRAPEIMLSFANYTTAIDVWSVGCILAELLGGKPIFKGRDYVDQLNQILHYLGTPSEDTLRRVGSPRAQDYIRSLPIKPRIAFATLYPNANPLAIDLLSKMLAFDPAKRISCEEALNHPYLSVWHDPNDEPVCNSKFDFAFEEEESMEGMKKMIVDEVNSFRSMVRAQARAAAGGKENANLSIPTRDEIISSPVAERVPANGATSSYTAQPGEQPQSPIMEDPSDQLEKELAGTHIGRGEMELLKRIASIESRTGADDYDPYAYSSLPASRSVPAEALRQVHASSRSENLAVPPIGHTKSAPTHDRSGRRRSATQDPTEFQVSDLIPDSPTAYHSAVEDHTWVVGSRPIGGPNIAGPGQQLRRLSQGPAPEPLGDFLNKSFGPGVVYRPPPLERDRRREGSSSRGSKRKGFLCCFSGDDDEGYH